MENILIVSEKSWNKELVSYLQSTMPQYAFYLISQKEDFTVERIGSISPVKIFIPHWSYIIPSAIFERYECIVFHMTDLPYGRGGSPLQNLIVRGLTATKLSALRVEVGLDTGPVYLKMDLSLSGTAEEIFVRVNKLVGKMIVEIIQNNTFYKYGFQIKNGIVEKEWLDKRKERLTHVFIREDSYIAISGLSRQASKLINIADGTLSVSYTHLTLPTILRA